MPVPYIFSNVPGGSSIPLAELDANFAYLTSGTPVFQNLNVTGALTVGGLLTASGGANLSAPLTILGNPVLGTTGSGNLVFSNSPTLVSPNLGTPSVLNLANAINLPISGITGLGVGWPAALASPYATVNGVTSIDVSGGGSGLTFTGGPVTTTGVITLSSGVLVPAYGGTGLTSFGAGVQAALSNPVNTAGGFIVIGGGSGLPVTQGGTGTTIAFTPGSVVFAGPGGTYTQDNANFFWDDTNNELILGQSLNAAGSVILNNVTSFNVRLRSSPVQTQSYTLTLPPDNGNPGDQLVTDGSGTCIWTSAPLPAGAVQWFAMAIAPTGWLPCDGQVVAQTTYPVLYTAIGTTFNTGGEPVGTFRLPDLRGEFVRGWDNGRGVDPGRIFGSSQAQGTNSNGLTVNDPGHSHGVNDPGHVHGTPSGAWFLTGENIGSLCAAGPLQGARPQTASSATNVSINSNTTGITITSPPGSETRPVNVALYPCIKY